MSKHPLAYSKIAILLHWVIALLIFGLFPLGLYMADLPLSPDKLKLFSYHKWGGITVLLLAAIRLTWRVGHPAPVLSSAIVGWRRSLPKTVHGLLYGLIFLVPLSGWLMSSALGFQVIYFGVFPLPNLIGKDKALAEILEWVHEALNYTLLCLVALHVAGALKHYFIDRDNILQRMLPFLKSRI